MTQPRPFGVIEGTGGRALLRRSVAPRLRPGEYPVWCELDLTSSQHAGLRRRAQDQGVGADAFVSLALEYRQLREAVGDDRLASLVDIARRELERPAIGGAPELRAWQRLIEGKSQPPDDELPSICIPLRLLTQVPVASRTEALRAAVAIDDPAVAAALTLEIVATRYGTTIGFWALSQRG